METRIAIICCIFYRGCLMPRNTFPELSQGLGCVGAGGGLTPASSQHKLGARAGARPLIGQTLSSLSSDSLSGIQARLRPMQPMSPGPLHISLSALLVSPLWVLRTQQLGLNFPFCLVLHNAAVGCCKQASIKFSLIVSFLSSHDLGCKRTFGLDLQIFRWL